MVANWRRGDHCKVPVRSSSTRRKLLLKLRNKEKTEDIQKTGIIINRKRKLAKKSRDKGFVQSISCQSPAALINDVTSFVQTSKVPEHKKMKILVATNSINETELGALRLGGLVPIVESLNKKKREMWDLAPAEYLVIDVLFMLESPLLFTYGSLPSNDIVEFERMIRGKPFCSHSESSSNSMDLNWCQIYKESIKVDRKKKTLNALKNDSTLETVPTHSPRTKKKSWKSFFGVFG
jgi:hypothetical protein